MTAPTLDDYRWLTSPEGSAALSELAAGANKVGQADVRLTARLRKTHSAARTHLLLEQLELRWRARDKFTDPARLFFTRKGLEQATDESVANYKARRFPAGALVADLCCGIGGDTLALAARGPVIGYEADAVTAHLANCNLQARGFDQSATRQQLANVNDVIDAAAWHIDPDRRATGQRVIQLADYEPGPDFLRSMLAANPQGAIKVAPAAEFNPLDWPTSEREWLGSRGECRQQVLWFGKLAKHPGMHTATDIGTPAQLHSFTGMPNQPFEHAASIGAYLYEPVATILAAKLAAAFAAELQLSAVTPGGGYLTADQLREHSLLTPFRVRDILPFDLRKLRAYCRERQLGQLEVKKRGVDIEPSRVRHEIIAKGQETAVIIIAPVEGSVKAIVAERMSHSGAR
jgi:hypothetical protein